MLLFFGNVGRGYTILQEKEKNYFTNILTGKTFIGMNRPIFNCWDNMSFRNKILKWSDNSDLEVRPNKRWWEGG